MDGSARSEPSLTAPGGQVDAGWHALTATVRGPTHIRDGTPNQDAVAWGVIADRPGATVLAVSDGHGSSRCFRSHIGAQLAVRAALAVAPMIAATLDDGGRDAEARSTSCSDRFATAIVEHWVRSVHRDLEERPLDDDELAHASVHRETAEEDPLRAYGATLLACVLTDRSGAFAQIGDGDLVLVRQDGTVGLPLPGDRRLIADETTSLCLTDAAAQFRCAVLDLDDDPVALVLGASDGYGNSFVTDPDRTWYEAVGADLLGHLRSRGPGWVAEHLEGWLTQSAEHSGDDTTVGLLYRDPVADGTPGDVDVQRSADADDPSAPLDGDHGQRPAVDPVAGDDADRDEVAPPGHRRPGVLVAVTVSALIVGGLLGLVAGRWLQSTIADGAGDSLVYEDKRWSVEGRGFVVTHDPESGELLGMVALETDGTLIGAGGGAIWVADGKQPVVYRIDAETMACDRITAGSPVVVTPCSGIDPEDETPADTGPDTEAEDRT